MTHSLDLDPFIVAYWKHSPDGKTISYAANIEEADIVRVIPVNTRYSQGKDFKVTVKGSMPEAAATLMMYMRMAQRLGYSKAQADIRRAIGAKSAN